MKAKQTDTEVARARYVFVAGMTPEETVSHGLAQADRTNGG